MRMIRSSIMTTLIRCFKPHQWRRLSHIPIKKCAKECKGKYFHQRWAKASIFYQSCAKASILKCSKVCKGKYFLSSPLQYCALKIRSQFKREQSFCSFYLEMHCFKKLLFVCVVPAPDFKNIPKLKFWLHKVVKLYLQRTSLDAPRQSHLLVPGMDDSQGFAHNFGIK